MNKSQLSANVAEIVTHIPVNVVDEIIKEIIEQVITEVKSNGRVEIRGFGSFSLNYHAQRQAHNPKTGELVIVKAKYVPHFKAGKDLKERVNQYR